MALTEYEWLLLLACSLRAAFVGLTFLVGLVSAFLHYQIKVEIEALRNEEFRATYVARARRRGWSGWLPAITASSLGWGVEVDVKSANVSLGTSEGLQKY